MQFPRRSILVRVQIQTSKLRAARNRFNKEPSIDNLNALLDELSSSRDLVSNELYGKVKELLDLAAHFYDSQILQLSGHSLGVVGSVENELVGLVFRLEDNNFDLGGRL